MDKHRLNIYLRIIGIPVAAFAAVTVLCSWLFQCIYLYPAVLASETLKTLTEAIFGMTILGSFVVTLCVILRRHHLLLGRSISTLVRITLVLLIVLSLLGLTMNIAVALATLMRIVGT